MAVDRWFFGGGAEHTPEAARRMLYASTSGAEGVGKSGDLKVVPLETPGQGVRVLIGSGLIKSNYIGGETQTYMGTVYEQEIVGTTPTGSSTGRSDLVVMRVEDPYAAGSPYTAPAEGDRALAPYIYIRVISGVPSDTKKLQDVAGYQNDTALTLARIDFPASTGTVTSGMIVDLRNVAIPQILRVMRAVDMDNEQQLSSTGAYPIGATFPTEFAGAAGVIQIPEWATHARITMTWGAVTIPTSGGYRAGGIWVQIGGNSDPDMVATTQGGFNSDGGRDTWLKAETLEIPPALRGTTKSFFPKARLASSYPAASRPRVTGASAVVLDVEFFERAS